jgi:hypothetical protein
MPRYWILCMNEGNYEIAKQHGLIKGWVVGANLHVGQLTASPHWHGGGALEG